MRTPITNNKLSTLILISFIGTLFLALVSVQENEGTLACFGLYGLRNEPFEYISLLSPFLLLLGLLAISALISDRYIYVKIISAILISLIGFYGASLASINLGKVTTTIQLKRKPSDSEETEIFKKTGIGMIVGYSITDLFSLVAIMPKNDHTDEAIHMLHNMDITRKQIK